MTTSTDSPPPADADADEEQLWSVQSESELLSEASSEASLSFLANAHAAGKLRVDRRPFPSMIGGVVPLATLAEDAAEFELAFESAFESAAVAAYGGETRWISDGEDESDGGGKEEGPDEEREAEREEQIEALSQQHELDAQLTQTPIEQETEEQSQTGGRLWTAILELGRSHTTKHSQSAANDKTHQFSVRSSSLNNSAPRLRSSSSTETLRNEGDAPEIPHFQHTPSVTHDSVTQSIQIPSHSTRTRFRPFSSPPAFQLSGTSNLSPSLSSSNRAPSPHLPPHFEESLLLSSKTRTGSKPPVFSNPFRRISLHKRSQTTYLRKPDSRFSLDVDATRVKPDLELRSQSCDTTTAATTTTTRQPVIIHRASADTVGSSLTIADSEDVMDTATVGPSNAKQQQEQTKGIKKLLQKTSAFFKLSVSSSSSSTAAPAGSLPTNGTPSKAHPRFSKRSKPTTPLEPNPLTKFGSFLTKSSTLSSSQPRADTAAAAAAAAAAPVPSNELVLPPHVLTTEHLKSQEMTSTYSINVRRSSLLSNITHRVGTRTNSTTNRPAANKINNHENTIDLLGKAKDLPPTASTPAAAAAAAAAVATNRTTTTALTILAASHNNQNNGDTSGINIELPAFSECSQEDVLDGIGSAADLRRVNTYAEEPIGDVKSHAAAVLPIPEEEEEEMYMTTAARAAAAAARQRQLQPQQPVKKGPPRGVRIEVENESVEVSMELAKLYYDICLSGLGVNEIADRAIAGEY